jgi:hypothetical protein
MLWHIDEPDPNAGHLFHAYRVNRQRQLLGRLAITGANDLHLTLKLDRIFRLGI